MQTTALPSLRSSYIFSRWSGWLQRCRDCAKAGRAPSIQCKKVGETQHPQAMGCRYVRIPMNTIIHHYTVIPCWWEVLVTTTCCQFGSCQPFPSTCQFSISKYFRNVFGQSPVAAEIWGCRTIGFFIWLCRAGLRWSRSTEPKRSEAALVELQRYLYLTYWHIINAFTHTEI